jgi:hypothetical protein
MGLDPATQDGINQLVDEALTRWFAACGQDGTSRLWTVHFGDDDMSALDLHRHAQVLTESRALDPTGLTTFMLLRGLAEKWLRHVRFTAYELLLDPASVAEQMTRLQALRDILEDPRVVRIITAFQDQLRAAAVHYGMPAAGQAELAELLADKYRLAYVRRDALESMKTLRPHQFIQGRPDPSTFQANSDIYEFWNLNSLLAAMRGQQVPGITVVLIRDPLALHSYFIFAVRNGETMTILTDQDEHAHPLQKMWSRRPDRELERRAARHWFPYYLLDLQRSDDDHLYAEARTALVPINVQGVKVGTVAALDPSYFVWTTLMFDLIREQYGRMDVRLPELSYTGQMVAEPHALVGAHSALVRAGQYAPIVVPPLTKADLTPEQLAPQLDRPAIKALHWMEERYGAQVPDSVLGVIGERAMPQLQAAVTALLPQLRAQADRRFFDREQDLVTLHALDPTTFGSREKLLADRAWLARTNYCRTVQRLAEEEYEREHAAITRWCQARLQANRQFLIDALVRGELELESWDWRGPGFATLATPRVTRRQQLRWYVGRDWDYHQAHPNFELCLGTFSQSRRHRMCAVLPARPASVFGVVQPDCPPALATLFGVTVAELPWALQHWTKTEPYTGNHGLERIDPGDWALEDPWSQRFNCNLGVALSRTAYRARRQALGLPVVTLTTTPPELD